MVTSAVNTSTASVASSSHSSPPAASNGNSNKPEITRLAQSLRREGTIEDILLKRKNEYKAHLDQLRRDREDQELNMLKSPHINKTSQQLVRTGTTHLRLYDLGKTTQIKREQMRATLEEQEKSLIKLQPHINKSSKILERSVDSIFAWKQERDQKQRELRQHLEEKELRECSRPKINPTSERLAKKIHRSDQKVEERLFKQHELSRKKREEQRRMSKEQEKSGASPMISIHSANLQREGEVSDRLYRISFDMMQKRHEQQERLEQDQVVPQNGHKLFSPLINSRSAHLQRDQPIEEILITKGEEAELKRRSQLQQEVSQLYEDQHKIKIGPYSQVLSEIKAKRENVSEQDRVHKPIRQIKPSFQAWVQEENQTLTFSPDINDNSREIDRQLHGDRTRDRAHLLFKKAEEYLKRRERLQQQQLAEEMAECTFTPRSSSPLPTTSLNNSIPSLGSASPAVTPEESRQFVNRNKEWAEKLQERLEWERQSLEAQQMEDCTFKPNISRMEIRETRRSLTPTASAYRRSYLDKGQNYVTPRRCSTPKK